jgi:hypothetical protein
MLTVVTIASYSALFATLKHSKQYQQKARIYISLINAAFLSVLSTHSFYNKTLHGPVDFLAQKEQTWLTDYTIGYFVSDLFLGHFFDKQNLNIITGYIHHTAFIALLYHIKFTHESNLIYMLLPFEIPTMILDINHLTKGAYSNVAFGVSFVSCRLLYNLYVIRAFYHYYTPYSIITTLLFLIHSLWFYQWVDKKANYSRG